MKKILVLFLLLANLSPALIRVARAQTAALSLQGVLVQDNGQAAPDSTYQLTFKLWKTPAGTAPADKVWEDTFNDVEVKGGKYNVILGTGAPLNPSFNQTYYLGVSLGAGSGAEFMPRPRLTAAPAGVSLLGTNNRFTSGGAVNIGTTASDASTVLRLESTTKGLLIPRLDEAQKKAIPQPNVGLTVYQTNNLTGFYYYDGVYWQHMTGSVRQIGDLYAGGIIFYVDAKGQHGLVAAVSNQSTGAPWGCSGTAIASARGTSRGSGRSNTLSIVKDCTTAGIAAKLCNDLVLNGYGDWYLPSKDELNLMYTNLKVNGLGGFSNNTFLSSTENSATQVSAQNFTNGTANIVAKTTSGYVRAIRAF